MTSILLNASRNIKLFSKIFYNPSVIKNFIPFKQNNVFQQYRSCSRAILDVNTKVIKDVILYQNENYRFFKMMSFFAAVQYTFWGYMSYITYNLRDTPISENKITDKTSWYMKINLGEKKYRVGLSVFCGTVAMVTLFGAWSFVVRSVRYVILHKGGDHVSFVTFSPLGVNRIHKIPLRDVSSCQARTAARGLLPIKVKRKAFNFLLDTKGNLRNPVLFDHTVGLQRTF